MYTKTFFASSLLALAATAAPTNTTFSDLETRGAQDTFKLHVYNNCHFVKEVALYQVTSDFKMIQKSTPTNVGKRGGSITIEAPFQATGMRLSGHAEMGTDAQWNPQAMFEFGHSTYAGVQGTAYDLSVMQGSDHDIGIGAYPIPNGRGSKYCPSKTCFPWHCPPSQGWTNPDQVNQGSPADTVCYKGKTDFKVVFCP